MSDELQEDQPKKRFAAAIPLIGMIGSVISGWFNAKTAGTQAVSSTASNVIGFLNQSQISDAEREAATATVIAADSASESILARNIRPAILLAVWIMIFLTVLEYYHPAPDTREFLFRIGEGGFFGYMPLRSVDKWISQAYKSKIFDKIINAVLNKKVI